MGILQNIKAVNPLGGRKYYCSACRRRVNFFLPFGVDDDFFKQHKIIGGGYREHVTCPLCGAHDRIRWTDYVLEQFTEIYKDECTVLHIAPEYAIRNKIKKNQKCTYITGDIEKGYADYIVDVTHMDFEKEQFDYIIINHVMEHVQDESKAFREVQRCLKKNGKLIISFPICMDCPTFEDGNIISEADRIKYYGQKDHCRLYGYDSKEHLESFGFRIDEKNVSEIMSKEEIVRMALMENDRIFICSKKG